ncbi:magnesium transporter CorA family protein [Xylophilus sp. ASV27]|uniref:magnesium transporter CorA family protein n=1 Tax=Xylophilus sp. ASV27 TaxID=2795129 RepID=UPI0018ED52C4|nr:magnesium transporter CorA family protein [Xylophilus sp. ASV27]
MNTHYVLLDGRAAIAAPGQTPDVSLYEAPHADEQRAAIAQLGIDARNLAGALDADELARVDFAPGCLSIIWKQPQNVSVAAQLRFDVGSMGLFLRQGRLGVVTDGSVPVLAAQNCQGCGSGSDVFLHLLDQTVQHYLGHLKAIKQITAELGDKITSSTENQYLLQMLALGESLIYYIDAIEANSAVLAKLQAHLDRLDFTLAQIELLNDVAMDNQQCARQARIHSEVVSGLMDARGTVIGNNVSILLKKLTLINIVFLPLNLIAGIGGMSEFSMMTQGIDWRISYALFAIGMLALGWGMWHALIRVLEKRQARR